MSSNIKSVLDICIPTYQRKEECIRQIEFLLNEVTTSTTLDKIKVNIIIRDNNSNLCCYEEILKKINETKEQFSKKDIVIRIERNETNLGLVGNLVKLVETDAAGDFLWYLGDDDILTPGIIDKIISHLAIENTMIFMNYNCVHKEHGVVKNSAFNAIDKKSLPSLFKKYDAIMMFITSSIYKRDVLLEALANLKANNLDFQITLPLYFAFFAENKGAVHYINDIYISDVVSDISWADVYVNVRLYLVPSEILRLKTIGYSAYSIYSMLVNYYLKNYRFLIGVLLRHVFPDNVVNKCSRFIRGLK